MYFHVWGNLSDFIWQSIQRGSCGGHSTSATEEKNSPRQISPQLAHKPGFLTDSVTRPDKTEAVQRFVSRFGKSTSAVGRPPVGEDPGITIQGQQEQEGESGNEGGSTGGNRSKGEKKRKDIGRRTRKKRRRKASARVMDTRGTRTKHQVLQVLMRKDPAQIEPLSGRKSRNKF